MIKNLYLAKIFGHFSKSSEKSLSERSIMHPERDWSLGILGGLVFLTAGLFWSLSIYTQFSNISIETMSTAGESSSYKEGLVDSALSDLAERQRSYDAIKTELIRNQQVSAMKAPVLEGIINEVEPGTEIDLSLEPEEAVILEVESL